MNSSWINATLYVLCVVLLMVPHYRTTVFELCVQQLTCMSENGGSALVWNNKLKESDNDVGSESKRCGIGPHLVIGPEACSPDHQRKDDYAKKEGGKWSDLNTSLENPLHSREFEALNLELEPKKIYKTRVIFHGTESSASSSASRSQNDYKWFVMLPVFVICFLALCAWCRTCDFSFTNSGSSSRSLVRNSSFSSTRRRKDPFFNHCAYPQKFKYFENYIKTAAENGDLEREFRLLPRGLQRPCQYGKLPKNKSKNRRGSIIPYDDTRVMLARDSVADQSDYINASYIQGYRKMRAYIATQCPLRETVVDFWRMIWQEEVRIICMMADLGKGGKNVCERYWPELGEELKYGNVIVLTINQHVFADYTYRTFLVKTHPGTESEIVKHLQYREWPEDEIPMYSHSIVEYLSKLLSVPPGQGPIVVHCCTGVGRTGSLILCDICLRRLAAEGDTGFRKYNFTDRLCDWIVISNPHAIKYIQYSQLTETVDVFAEAKIMYNARGDMLDSCSQYVLSHLVPTQCLVMLPTKVPCSDISPGTIAEMKNSLPVHIRRLEDCSWMDRALRPLGPLKPPCPENVLKNRFPKLTPVGPNLVTLERYPTNDSNGEYISAVSLDGVKIRKQYIASQLPLPSTLTDFWRLIIEKNVELVMILQRPDLSDSSCCEIINHFTTLIPLPNVTVEPLVTSDSGEYFTTDKLLLTDTSKGRLKTRNITLLTCNNWSRDAGAKPPASEALVELWKASEKIARAEGPTLVLCYDGLTGCGLYLALSFMLERMAVEQECDVILAVRAVRRSRPEFVTSKWQFEYLYDAAVTFVNSFQSYANFT